MKSILHVLLQTSGPGNVFLKKKKKTPLLLCIIKYFISLSCIDFLKFSQSMLFNFFLKSLGLWKHWEYNMKLWHLGLIFSLVLQVLAYWDAQGIWTGNINYMPLFQKILSKIWKQFWTRYQVNLYWSFVVSLGLLWVYMEVNYFGSAL